MVFLLNLDLISLRMHDHVNEDRSAFGPSFGERAYF